MVAWNLFKKKQSGGQRVLVIDDEPHITKLVMANLISDGYDVRCVNNSVHALEVAKEWQPQMILLDIMMPPPDGFTVYKDFKNEALTKDIPVIFMTVKDEEQIKKGISFLNDEASFYRYHLQKPFSKTELLGKVKRILSGEW